MEIFEIRLARLVTHAAAETQQGSGVIRIGSGKTIPTWKGNWKKSIRRVAGQPLRLRMTILDTDILSLFFANHVRVVERYRAQTDEVVTTIISRIETLQGRFATLFKAADGNQLRRGQERLIRAESDLAVFRHLPINVAAAVEFDKLRAHKKLKKIGQGDLLIASIALAYGAKLVTRNTRDFHAFPA